MATSTSDRHLFVLADCSAVLILRKVLFVDVSVDRSLLVPDSRLLVHRTDDSTNCCLVEAEQVYNASKNG